MSYTNGVGNPQQSFDTVDTATSVNGNRPVGPSSSSIQIASSDASSAGFGVDNATLSSTAGLISNALSGSDVRYEKVAALQQQIAAGTYSVSSSDVADKLLSSLLK